MFNLWGAQVEEDDTMTAYIATTATAASSSSSETTGLRTPNSRTDMVSFRQESRYVKAEVNLVNGFTTALGADVEFTPTSKV